MKTALFALVVSAALGVFAGSPGARTVCGRRGAGDAVVRCAAVSEKARGFTVALRFRAEEYRKRPGPWEGMVFSNGTGWYDGFRATMTPAGAENKGFRMSLRVVKSGGGAAGVSLGGTLDSRQWYHLAFVWDGSELKSFVNGALAGSSELKERFKRPKSGFALGPSGYGVGYYPFEAEDVKTWERPLGDDEVMRLATGGLDSPAETGRFLAAMDEAEFSGWRMTAWRTARRLAEAGDRKGAADLYSLLASRRPTNREYDGGNSAAAGFARFYGDADARSAVTELDCVGFAGYPGKLRPRPKLDEAAGVHVAPAGDDISGDGTAKRPFASLAKALAAVRGRGIRQIFMHGGRYRMEKGVKITAADSGTEDSPLVIAASSGETPVLDGGSEVTGFKPSGRGGTMVADVGGNAFSWLTRPEGWGWYNGSDKLITDLYEDDVPGELARHPNAGFLKTVWSDKTNLTFRVDLPDLASWAAEPDLMALTYMRWLWGDETTYLRIEPDTGTMQIDTNRIARVATGRPVKLLNSLKALDEPGEWFLDYRSRKLYLWPRKNGSRVVLSRLGEPFIDIVGAENVEIWGLRFEAGRSCAVSVKNGRRLRIARCEMRNLGYSVKVSGTRDVEIVGNRMRSFSRGAISVYSGDRRTLEPSGVRILRNKIGDIERKCRTYCPCVHAEGVGVEIAWNHFHDCPSSAVRLEGNDMLINSNLVERCVLESDDQGAVDIYANPSYAGIEIIGNVWRDIGCGGEFAPCGQAAVRFDDVISGVKVRLNRFYNCGHGHFGAVQINGGRMNVIDNNLFVGCRKDVSIGIRTPQWWKKTMTEGYAAKKISWLPIGEAPWSVRYPYMSRLLDWPCVNYISRNIYVDTPRTSRRIGENGNIRLSAEPEKMPDGYDPL